MTTDIRDDRTVVLLHGWPGLPSDYDAVIADLTDLRTLTPDLLGMGTGFDGIPSVEASTAESHAERVLGQLDDAGITSGVIIVGYDIGSRIAQAALRADPSRFHGAVLTPARLQAPLAHERGALIEQRGVVVQGHAANNAGAPERRRRNGVVRDDVGPAGHCLRFSHRKLRPALVDALFQRRKAHRIRVGAAGHLHQRLHERESLERILGVPDSPFELLRQVLLNLIVNAEYAMQGGSHRVLTIRTFARAQRVIVEVADTGCGMTPEVQKRIFEPFFTTKPDGRGTGLGLSVSYGILQTHGGTLTVHTAPGAGATFRISLPTAGHSAGAPSSDSRP